MKRTGNHKRLSEAHLHQDPATVHPVLREFLGYCLNKVAIRYRSAIGEALSQHSLHILHLAILTVLEHQQSTEPLNQNQLACEMGVDKATMVKFVDQLESLGWVQRMASPRDRRMNVLSLTTAGRRQLQRLRKISLNTQKDFFGSLTKSELQSLKDILQKLLD